LGATTVQVGTIAVIIARYLFPIDRATFKVRKWRVMRQTATP
jgi:hypothetical protein